MTMLNVDELKQIEDDLKLVINVNIKALDSILRQCDKAGLVRVALAAAAFPDRPKYDLDSPEEVECYSVLQDIQEAHFKLFGVKAGIFELEEETESITAKADGKTKITKLPTK